MPTALLAGAFGQRNPGDEALLDAFADALDGWDVVATTSTPPWSGSTAAATDGVPSGDPSRVARRVAGADAVVFAGGTIFKELSPATGRPPLDLLQKGLAMAYGAKALGKPLALVGVGAAPISSKRGRLLARRLVHQADLLVLRDEESAALLDQAGAPAPFRVGADAAWTLLAEPTERAGEGEGVLVALSHEAGGDGLCDDLAAALVPVLAAGHRVWLQPWQIGGPVRPDDLDLARAVRSRLGGAAELLLPPADLHEARATFAGARLVVGLRFHALVAAAAAGTPFLAYAHEPKLAAIARRLRQPAVLPEASADAAGAAIAAAASHPVAPAGSAVRAELARAEEGMRLLRLLLSDGRSEEADVIGALPLKPAEWAS